MLTQYQLKNKMKVLLIESHKAPVVAVQVWVKTGSADEKKKEEGLSHFIEHLVFKGTRKFGVGEIARIVEGSGGELNAYTTFDQTVFHVTMSEKDLEVGLECLSEMMGYPKFDGGEIDREREVVIEEIKRSFDNPNQVASQQLFSTLYRKHPYGIPVIGYEKNIREVSKSKIAKYYHSRYVPSNMTLVVAGSFEKPETKKLIEKYYAGFEKSKLNKITRAVEPKQKHFYSNYKTTEFQEASLNLAFRGPGAKSKDIAAIDVMCMILGVGDSSRLMQKLRMQKPLVMSVGAGSYNPLDNGFIAVSAHFQMENIREIFSGIQEEILRLLSEPPSIEELERAKLNIQSDEIFGLETVDGLARKVGIYQLMLNDPQYFEQYIKQVQKLTAKDILLTARKYFNPANLTVTMLLNKKEEAQFSKKDFLSTIETMEKTIGKVLKQPVPKVKPMKAKVVDIKTPMKLKPSVSPIAKHRLSNGALVILKKNPEVPVMSIKMGFLGGLRLESEQNNGATLLLSNTWTSGTGKLTEELIAATVENNAASLSAFGGRNSVGLSFDCIKGYFEKLKPTLSDVVTGPTFPQGLLNREAHIQKEHLKNRADSPQAVVSQKFMENIFEGHPYAKDLLGQNSFLDKAKTSDIQKLFSQTVNSDNAVIVAAGDFDESKLLKYFEEVSTAMGNGKKQEQVFALKPLTESKKIFLPLAKEQTHIIVGYRGISLTDERRYALEVLQAILAGQGGRLFLELRDKASLAYTVAPIHMNGIESGYFGAYIGCSPEKGEKAISMLDIEFQKLIDQAPSLEEVNRARKYLIGQNHIGLQKNSSQATSILFDEIYGIDSRETFHFYEHVKNIKPADIHKLARELFDTKSITVAVGAKCPW